MSSLMTNRCLPLFALLLAMSGCDAPEPSTPGKTPDNPVDPYERVHNERITYMDTDQDYVADADEVACGTDPFSSASVPAGLREAVAVTRHDVQTDVEIDWEALDCKPRSRSEVTACVDAEVWRPPRTMPDTLEDVLEHIPTMMRFADWGFSETQTTVTREFEYKDGNYWSSSTFVTAPTVEGQSEQSTTTVYSSVYPVFTEEFVRLYIQEYDSHGELLAFGSWTDVQINSATRSKTPGMTAQFRKHPTTQIRTSWKYRADGIEYISDEVNSERSSETYFLEVDDIYEVDWSFTSEGRLATKVRRASFEYETFHSEETDEYAYRDGEVIGYDLTIRYPFGRRASIADQIHRDDGYVMSVTREVNGYLLLKHQILEDTSNWVDRFHYRVFPKCAEYTDTDGDGIYDIIDAFPENPRF